MRRCLALAVLAVACQPPLPEPSPVFTCLDLSGGERCIGDACEPVACRGDEVCQDDACIAWTAAELGVDFDVTLSQAVARRITVEVHPGGFPRAWVRTLRFDFGDGSPGWGELLSHTYEDDGVYAVSLEVRLADFRILRASRTVVIGAEEPSAIELTLNGIPLALNGSRPTRSDAFTPGDTTDDTDVMFHLLVPTEGFDIDVVLLDGVDAIDPSSVRLVADVDLGEGALTTGTDLFARFVFPSAASDRVRAGRWRVAPADAFPTGMVTLTLSAETLGGDPLTTQSLSFETTPLTPELDPFDRPMQWLFRFDLDLYTLTATELEGGAIVLEAAEGADGVDDFDQELRAIGAQGDESAPGAADLVVGSRQGVNAVFRRKVIEAIIQETYRYFHMAPDGTPTERMVFGIAADDEPGAPDPADFSDTGDFSMMRFGGTLGDSLGRSGFAVHNEGRVDDTALDRGVATATLIGTLVALPELTDEFLAIKPNTGTPVGDDANDAIVLDPAFDPFAPDVDPVRLARHAALRRAADFIGQIVASVTAHEMGHAMGLVPNGVPPVGLFGGRGDIAFMNPDNTDSHHADYPGLNLMQAGGNFAGVLFETLEIIELPPGATLVEVAAVFSGENRLSAYERAYLNGQLTHTGF